MGAKIKNRPEMLIVGLELLSFKSSEIWYAMFLRKWFEQWCDVSMASCYASAVSQSKSPDIILVVGLGGEIAGALKYKFPNATVCIITDDFRTTCGNLQIHCIEKSDKNSIVPEILNLWLLEQEPETMELLPLAMYRQNMLVYGRSAENGLETFHMCALNNWSVNAVASAMRNPEHRNRVNYYAALSQGCPGRCRMCGTGKICPYVPLNRYQIAGQLGHLFTSFKSRGYLYEDTNISMKYYNGGDPRYCMCEIGPAFEIVDTECEKHKIKVTHTLASIGGKKTWEKISELKGHKVNAELSLHSTIQRDREWLLPETVGEFIEEQIDLLDEHAIATGSDNAVRYMLVPDFNDSERDVSRLACLLDGTHLKVKVMIVTHGCLPEFPKKLYRQDGLNFTQKLKALGVDAEYKDNLGKIGSNCGNHIPAKFRHIVDGIKKRQRVYL